MGSTGDAISGVLVVRLRQFWTEIKRRKVGQATLAYVGFALLILQTSQTLTDALEIPAWSMRVVLLLLVIGLPIVIAISWSFDLTLPALVREDNAKRGEESESLYAVLVAQFQMPGSSGGDSGQSLMRAQKRWHASLRPLCRRFGGEPGRWQANRIAIGFLNPAQAGECAIALQRLAEPPARLAIAIGNVLRHDGDWLGEGMALASDLIPLAPEHGTVMTEQVLDSLIHRETLQIEPIPPQSVPTLDHPLRVYRVRAATETNRSTTEITVDQPLATKRTVATVAFSLLLLTGVAAAWLWTGNSATLPMPQMTRVAVLSSHISALADDPELTPVAIRLTHELADKTSRQMRIYIDTEETGPVDYRIHGKLQRHQQQLQLSLSLNDHNGTTLANRSFAAHDHRFVDVVAQAVEFITASLIEQTNSERLHVVPVDEAVPWQAYQHYVNALNVLESANADSGLQATQELDLALQLAPRFALAYAARCNARRQQFVERRDFSQLPLANQDCTQAEALAPTHYEVQFARAHLLRDENRFDEAGAIYERLLQTDPGDFRALRGLADVWQQAGRLIDAEHALQRAINMQPDFWLPRYHYAYFLSEQGRQKEAVNGYQQVIRLAPRSAIGYHGLGNAHFLLGELELAANAYTSAMAIEPTYGVHVMLGNIYYLLGRFHDAANEHHRALTIADNDFHIFGNLADAERHAGKPVAQYQSHYTRALKGVREALQLSPDDPHLHALLAWYAEQLGDKTLADQHLHKAVALASNQPEALYQMTVLAAARGDLINASQFASKAISAGYPLKILSSDPDIRSMTGQTAFLAALRQHTTN